MQSTSVVKIICEHCQVLRCGTRAKLSCSLIPLTRLRDIGLNTDYSEPLDQQRIERLPQQRERLPRYLPRRRA